MYQRSKVNIINLMYQLLSIQCPRSENSQSHAHREAEEIPILPENSLDHVSTTDTGQPVTEFPRGPPKQVQPTGNWPLSQINVRHPHAPYGLHPMTAFGCYPCFQFATATTLNSRKSRLQSRSF